jgi:hypothetical protein
MGLLWGCEKQYASACWQYRLLSPALGAAPNKLWLCAYGMLYTDTQAVQDDSGTVVGGFIPKYVYSPWT